MSTARSSLTPDQLQAENHRLRAELSVVNSIQQGMAAGLGIDEIIDRAGRRITEIFPGHAVALYTQDPDSDLAYPRFVYEYGERRFPDPVAPGPIGQRMQAEKQPFMISTRKEFSAIGANTVAGTAASLSGIYCPLLIEDRVIGALNIESPDRENAFTSEDLDLLRTIAGSLSVALENARLFDELQRSHKQLNAAFAQQSAVSGILRAMAAMPSELEPVLQAVAEQAGQLCQADDVQVYQVDGDRLRQVAHAGPLPGLEEGETLPLVPGLITGRAVLERRTIHVHDAKQISADEYPVSVQLQRKLQHRSAIATPLLRDDSAIGAIVARRNQVRPFSDKQVQLLAVLADQAAIAIDNVRMFHTTRRLLNESQERAAELAIINTIQRALADKKDVNSIYQAAGDKLRGIFNSQVITIFTADLERREWSGMYGWEKGQYLENMVVPFNSVYEYFAKQDDTVVMNGSFPEWSAQFDDYKVPQGELPKSVVIVPIPGTSKSMQKEFLSLQDIDGDRVFTDADVRLLETIASSIGVALENARLFDESQRLLQQSEERAAELAIINTVQRSLAAELDIDSIYEAVGEQLRSIFESQIVTIYAADLQKRQMVTRYGFEKGERLQPMSVPFNSMYEATNSKLLEGEPIVFNGDFTEFAAQFDDYRVPQGELPQSVVVVPIPRSGHSHMVESISLQDVDGERYFTKSDIRLLETLAGSMGVALENARLLDETQRLLQETEQRAAELETINTVSQALVAESELELLIQLIGEQVRQIFAADIAYVALLDEQQDRIHFPYSFGEEFPPMDRGEGLTSKIIDSGQPLLINEQMDRRRAELGIEQVGKRASSYLGVPIQMGGKTLGVMSAQSTSEEGRFDENDLRLLSTIAANVGTAIRNAQLFDEIKRQKQYYQAVIQNSPAAIVLLDMEANVSGWNPAAERLFGYREAEAVGRNVDELVAAHPDLRQEAIGYSRSVLREREISKLTKRTRKDGSLVEVDLAGVPVTVDGEYVGFIAIYHDVTELQQARLAAEQASQAKSTFLANMSHELRTPLNAIIGFTRIVRRKGEGSLPEKQLENLDKVLVSADHLLSLINTVLDIAKIEAGRLDVKPTSFELPPLLEQLLATTQPLLQESVELSADIPADLPPLYSDQDKLRQILLNLLSNAAKFTPEGEVRLSVRQLEDHIRVDVADSGIGIETQALEHIFEEFQQADSSTTRQYGGTGLGLAISRSLARLLGGDIRAESKLGAGSTFKLTLPIHYSSSARYASAGTERPDTEVNVDAPLLLAIDDDTDVHELLRQNLAEADYRVVSATSGAEGLRLAKKLKPAAITLDIMMPHKDGWQVLHELKSDTETRNIPVILLTIVDKPARGFRLGAAEYLVKPIQEEALLEALHKLNIHPGAGGQRVLLVDDDASVQAIIHELLADSSLELLTASNGQEALDLIEQERPDVILLDLMMPVMDGFEVLRALQEQGVQTPVIVLTAKDLNERELAELENRVERVLPKGNVDPGELLAELRRWISTPLTQADRATE
ncbi:MAG: GAF domain-containing protein [Anaerolineales bacterium]|nr:GAF domain-containing protein [Anaerolineales bacterium]